jgi:hypothetical protein
MTRALARFLYEHSPYNAFWSAYLVGFCDIDSYGRVFITDEGQDYLGGVA